jgi:hypothetical protein
LAQPVHGVEPDRVTSGDHQGNERGRDTGHLIEIRNQRLDQGGRHGNDDEGGDGA